MSWLDEFYKLKNKEQEEDEKKSVGKVVTESVVEAAALATPGLGILWGGLLSGRSILEGKPKEAIFRLAAGISGTFPGVGTVASLYISGITGVGNIKEAIAIKDNANKKNMKTEEYIKSMIAAASVYEDERIRNIFASGDQSSDSLACMEMLSLLKEKKLKAPANPTDIFETMFFKDNGAITITYFTDDDGTNYWAPTKEERIALRERNKNFLQSQRALHDMTDPSPSKHSGNEHLDSMLDNSRIINTNKDIER